MRVCTKCGAGKSLALFSKSKMASDGLHTWCKVCKAASARIWHSKNTEYKRGVDKSKYKVNGDHIRAQATRWYEQNRDRGKQSRREYKLRKYGLTSADYLAMLTAQGGVCVICKKEADRHKDMHVDHDHVTGHVRGLLCHHCNVGIGHFFDSPELLVAASRYLTKNTFIEKTA